MYISCMLVKYMLYLLQVGLVLAHTDDTQPTGYTMATKIDIIWKERFVGVFTAFSFHC